MNVAYTAVTHSHSGLRWIVLLLLILAVFRAIDRRKSGVVYPGKDKLALFALISVHIQLLLGLVLYLWLSPYGIVAEPVADGTQSVAKFYNWVHWYVMIIATVIITIGYSRAKREAEMNKGWKTIAVNYGIGLVIILLAIPWPFYPGLSSVGWN
jgi:hypothetical protein